MEVIQQLNFKEYQAIDGFSYSLAKRILNNSNKWALGIEEKRTQALDFGSLAHDMILSPSEIENKYVIFDDLKFRDKRTKAYREALTEIGEQIINGKIVIHKSLLQQVEACVNAVKPILDKYLVDGKFEVSHIVDIDGITFKGRTDFISNDGSTIIDLKFVSDASKEGFTSSVAKFGYHIQNAFYKDLTQADKFLFIAIEKEAPYMLGVYDLSPEAIDLGRQRYLEALEIYKNKELYTTNQYQNIDTSFGISDDIQTLTLPAWAWYK